MRRLLLITDSFPPAFAPRMGYLCKYLKGIGGWQVTVLHMPPSDNSHSQSFGYLSGFADKVYEYDGTDGARKLFRGQVADMLHGRNSIWGFIMMVWSKLVMRILGEPTNFTGRRFVRELLSQDEYDVILASTGGHCNTVNKLAYYASRRANIPVVLDFRDMFEQYAHGRKTVSLRSRISLWTRNRLIRHANNVIGVCAEETEILKKFNDRVHNIMNGYDPDVFSPLFPVKSDVFKIVYVGSTNTTTYPVELFVKGFTRFINGRFKPSVHVEFYSTKETYESGVAQYLSGDVQSFFERRDCVAQTKLPSVLAQASVLIVFGHKTTGVPVGVSTKVYEYLAVNRPILEINLGDLRKCEDIIRGGGGGIASTSEEVCAFLAEAYSEWEANGFVCGRTDMEYVRQFSRKTQAEQFEKVLEDAVSSSQIIDDETPVAYNRQFPTGVCAAYGVSLQASCQSARMVDYGDAWERWCGVASNGVLTFGKYCSGRDRVRMGRRYSW